MSKVLRQGCDMCQAETRLVIAPDAVTDEELQPDVVAQIAESDNRIIPRKGIDQNVNKPFA
jgi:hypothetical protein